jgi:general secretion pathway protein K
MKLFWTRLKKLLKREVIPTPHGIALVMVLIGITIGATVVSEASYQANLQRQLAMNSIRQTKGYFLAKSGVNIARLLLEMEQMMFAMLPNLKKQNIQMYRYADIIAGVFNTAAISLPIGQINLSAIKGLGELDGTFRVTIEPEDTRFNLNALDDKAKRADMIREMLSMMSPDTYREMFERTDVDGNRMDQRTIIANIIDWVDKDTIRTVIDADGYVKGEGGGDEDSIYQSDRRPYKTKNAKFDSVEELRMIRGVDDVFIETFGDEFTVYRGNKVNVNSASIKRMRALLCNNMKNPRDPLCNELQPDLLNPYLQIVLDERAWKEMFMQTPFKKEDDFLAALDRAALPPYNLPPLVLDKKKLKKNIGVRSTVYRITAEGQVKNLFTSIESVIDTDKKGAMYYWRVH